MICLKSELFKVIATTYTRKKLLLRGSSQWQKESYLIYFDLILVFHVAVACTYQNYVESKCLRHLISINKIQHWAYWKRLSFSIIEWLNSIGGRRRSLFYGSYQCWSYWSKCFTIICIKIIGVDVKVVLLRQWSLVLFTLKSLVLISKLCSCCVYINSYSIFGRE